MFLISFWYLPKIATNMLPLIPNEIDKYILKDLSQFQWKSAHAPKKELPKDFL